MRAPTLVLVVASVVIVGAAAQVGGARALAADGQIERPLVHPIYAQLPDLAENEITKRSFAAASQRYKLQPLEVIDIPAVPPPRTTPAALNATIAKTLKLAFEEALPELEADVAEVVATGGAGLSPAELSDLFLYRAMATARADWKSPVAPEP